VDEVVEERFQLVGPTAPAGNRIERRAGDQLPRVLGECHRKGRRNIDRDLKDLLQKRLVGRCCLCARSGPSRPRRLVANCPAQLFTIRGDDVHAALPP
jgi:hypothetical protein